MTSSHKPARSMCCLPWSADSFPNFLLLILNDEMLRDTQGQSSLVTMPLSEVGPLLVGTPRPLGLPDSWRAAQAGERAVLCFHHEGLLNAHQARARQAGQGVGSAPMWPPWGALASWGL